MLGRDRILYILVEGEETNLPGSSGVYLPIGKLSNNDFNETTETLGTTTRANNGWRSNRANFQSFNVSFEGIQVKTTGDNCETQKVSYDRLKQLKRTRSILRFQIRNTNGDANIEVFGGIIDNLGETASVGEFLTFSGSIQGQGEPKTVVLDCIEVDTDLLWTYDTADTYDSSHTIFND